jgi:hypothetical protein
LFFSTHTATPSSTQRSSASEEEGAHWRRLD